MKAIESEISGKEYPLIELESKLKPHGYAIGSGWDYDHGSFDYQLSNEGGYVFLRVPFEAIEGALDRDGCIVKLGEPFVLHHKYRTEKDQEEADITNMNAAFNQFQTPLEKDAEVSNDFIEAGKQRVGELERHLLS